jgi:benzoyl-CoA reductase/2-hydroxyglutaryl-CoA dehydratase subunit BcrC/BadD/HgdB
MRIGFTTSFPIEVVIGAGHEAIDLNNIFILSNAEQLVTDAERKGFPRNICSWIKGMYGTIISNQMDAVIGIVQGDCSNTHSLMSILEDQRIEVIPFSFPYSRDYQTLNREIEKLEERFHSNRKNTLEAKKECDVIRKMLIELDQLTWKDKKVSSKENHLWLVSSSDFNGNLSKYRSDLGEFLKEAKDREAKKGGLRLGYIGVPPIITDLFDFLEQHNVHIVYNEVQRQFSMFYLEEDIVNQYLMFTYPYTIWSRITDIQTEIRQRSIDGIISYTQSFCHRQLDHILMKKHIQIAMLQLEGDQPGVLDERSKIRIESFIEMLSEY